MRLLLTISSILLLSISCITYAGLSDSTIQLLKQKAKEGDPHAQLKIGYRAYTTSQYQQAYRWFQKLTQQQGAKYYKGNGYNMIGLMYMDGRPPLNKNYKQAKKSFKKAIGLDNKQAYGNLAILYDNGGYGVQKDKSKAKHYYQLGAKQGDPSAQFNLGSLYANQKQYKKAFHWYHQSAKQYYLSGMLQTALSYSLGKGVNKDKIQACKWLKVALKVYPHYQEGQKMLQSVKNELGIYQQRACNKAVKHYLQSHNVPRKSEFKARLELKS